MIKKLAFIAFATALLSPISAQAYVETTCFVNDPTGTPLNVRATPNGKIVYKLRNGTVIENMSEEKFFDSKGRQWTFIFHFGPENPSQGYVISKYIKCV